MKRPCCLLIASFASLTLLMSQHSLAQEVLPPLDLIDTAAPASFVPGEIIVKLKDAPPGTASEGGMETFEAAAFADQIRPLSGGAFLVRLDTRLFTPQSTEDLEDRTRRVAQELEKREDIASARTDGAGEVIVQPTDEDAFERSVAAGEFETIVLEGAARPLEGGAFSVTIDRALLSPASDQTLRERTLEALEELRKRPDVEYAQLNYVIVHKERPDDLEFQTQWNLFDNGTTSGESPGGINLPREWDNEKGKPSVIVAVIDSGILLDHQDVVASNNLVAGFDMISDDARASDTESGRDANPRDEGDGVPAGACGNGRPFVAEPDSWHGSHVAGIVGVAVTNNRLGIAGVNWEVKIQPIRALGKCGGTVADLNDAIRWAAGLPVNGVPPNATKASVINLSLGIPIPCSAFPGTQAAISDAVRAGVTVVAAAGNEAIDAAGATPAGCEGVIAVAASDARGHLAERYSNFGDVVDILAPGGDVRRDDDEDQIADGVLSLVNGGYRRYNGTSMAAPHVAGVAALVLAREPNLLPSEVLTRLQRNAIPRTQTQCPRRCGAGLLNAFFLDHAPSTEDVAPAGGSPATEQER